MNAILHQNSKNTLFFIALERTVIAKSRKLLLCCSSLSILILMNDHYFEMSQSKNARAWLQRKENLPERVTEIKTYSAIEDYAAQNR